MAKTEQYIDRLMEERRRPPERGLRGFRLRDVRVFLNTVNHNLELIRSAGIDADCGKEETEHEIVLTIRIPKKAV